MLRLDHLPPPFGAQRPEIFANKSLFTNSCPIFACSFSTSASTYFAVSVAANFGAVSWSRSASSANLSLKSDEYRVRWSAIQGHPSLAQTKLKRLSEDQGPPQCNQVTARPFDGAGPALTASAGAAGSA